jgi:hypothetical protein
MTKNIHNKWNLISEDLERLIFWELHDLKGSLIILLKNLKIPNKFLKIKFDGVISYRVTVEAGKLGTIHANQYLGPFYIVDNSTYLMDVLDESGGIFDDSKLIHYSIWNSDNIIDVISGPPVETDWIASTS